MAGLYLLLGWQLYHSVPENGLNIVLGLGVYFAVLVVYRAHLAPVVRQKKWVLLLLAVILCYLFREASLILGLSAGIYWLLHGRSRGMTPPYFVKYHWLNMALWFMVALLFLIIVTKLFALTETLLTLPGLGALALPISSVMSFIYHILLILVVPVPAIYMAFQTVTDRTPPLPVIGASVRYWA
ncbi:MAG: hypothetical protein AB7P76_10995 [Candidatus Melainabacteria bacterium]